MVKPYSPDARELLRSMPGEIELAGIIHDAADGGTSEEYCSWTMANRAAEALMKRLATVQCPQQAVFSEAPVAWIVKWSTKHTPKNASAYLNEADAKRAAANVKMYADASDVVVIPALEQNR